LSEKGVAVGKTKRGKGTKGMVLAAVIYSTHIHHPFVIAYDDVPDTSPTLRHFAQVTKLLGWSV
jgi:hypothetical protein